MKDELAKPESIARLKEIGYDGVILPLQTTDTLGLANLGLNTKGNEYIVFNSNQAKNIDNLNPSSNPDIRYSMDTVDSSEEKVYNKYHIDTLDEKVRLRSESTLKNKVLLMIMEIIVL